MTKFLLFIGTVLAIAALIRLFFRKVTVYEYERGVLFQNGVMKRTLEPGGYWLLRLRGDIQKVDVRLRTVAIPSQEILTADNVTIKITLAAQYVVSDPIVALTKIERFQDAFYTSLQLALREIVSGTKADELVAKRGEIGKKTFETTEGKVKEFGLTLKLVDVKDVMFPGELKKIFAQVVKAQKEGLAILEKARGETAALRNLANAAKLLENTPGLLHLRALHTLESSVGNTVILGFPPEGVPLPVKKDRPSESKNNKVESDKET
jgi:regulator of protease activity HflC (stomatin/prohibitin superfamily)